MRVAAEPDEASVRQQGGELAAAADRDRPIAAAVDDERRRGDAGQEGSQIGVEIELEVARGCVGLIREARWDGGDLEVVFSL